VNEALAWIGQIADWIGKFVPRWKIVAEWELGLKLPRGRNPQICTPGIWWYWPASTVWVIHPTKRQGVNLKSQTITTADGKAIIAGGLIVFEVADVVKLVVDTYMPDETVKEISLTAVHDVCCLLTWEQLQQEQRSGELDKKLKVAATGELRRYGVRVLKMTLTDLALTRVIKIVQSTSQD